MPAESSLRQAGAALHSIVHKQRRHTPQGMPSLFFASDYRIRKYSATSAPSTMRYQPKTVKLLRLM